MNRVGALMEWARDHPRLALALAYWLVSIPVTFDGLLKEGAADMATMTHTGAWGLWLATTGVLLVLSAVFGPLYFPLWALLHIFEFFSGMEFGGTGVFGPAGRLLAMLLLLLGAIRLIQGLGDPTKSMVKEQRLHNRQQGRSTDHALARGLRLHRTRTYPGVPLDGRTLEPGLPLAYVGRWQRRVIGLPPDADHGHVGVIGPTRSGKSFHLTDTLLRWPGPAVVIDPKGEQWQRTAGFRQAHYGPVYRIPPQGVDLAALYDLGSDLDRRELHETLLQPWREGRDRIFADKALALFHAAVQYGQATGEHPLRVLAGWAQGSSVGALLTAKQYAPNAVLTFTDGTAIEELARNRFALSAWGTFSTKFGPYVAHAGTITATSREDPKTAIPVTWAADNATIYVTYPLQVQAAIGPLAAAIVAGLMRHLLAAPPARRTLFAIDEMPTVGLPRVSGYLATVGGSGITMLLYAQSVAQMENTYGSAEALSILSNCTSQVFYPPRDPKTARVISEAFGSALEIHQSAGGDRTHWGTRYRPALEVAEAMALSAGQVVLFTHGLRHVAGDSKPTVLRWLERRELPPPPPLPAPPPAIPLVVPGEPVRSVQPTVSFDGQPQRVDAAHAGDVVRPDRPEEIVHPTGQDAPPPPRNPARNEHRNRRDRRRPPDDDQPSGDAKERYW